MENCKEPKNTAKCKKVINIKSKSIKLRGFSDSSDEESKPQVLPPQAECHSNENRSANVENSKKLLVSRPVAQKSRFPGQNDFLEGEKDEEEPEELSDIGRLGKARKQSNIPTETVSYSLENVSSSRGRFRPVYCFPEMEMNLPSRYSVLLKKPGKEDADNDTDDEQMKLATRKVCSDLREAIDMNRRSLNKGRIDLQKSPFGHLSSVQNRRLADFKNIPMAHPHHRKNTMRSSFFWEKGGNSLNCSTQPSPKYMNAASNNYFGAHLRPEPSFRAMNSNQVSKGSTGFLHENFKSSGFYEERKIGSVSMKSNSQIGIPSESREFQSIKSMSKGLNGSGSGAYRQSSQNPFCQAKTKGGQILFEKSKWKW